jgi:hypothetical protein
VLFVIFVIFVATLAGCRNHPSVDGTSAESAEPADTDAVADGDTGSHGAALAEATDGVLRVEAWAAEAPHVGHNRLAYRVLDANGAPVEGAEVTNGPWLEVDGEGHGCPATPLVAMGEGWYEGEIVYIVGGTWTDFVRVSEGGRDRELALTYGVEDTGFGAEVTVEELRWFVSFDPLGEAMVGANPFLLTVHEMSDMVSFPEVPDLSVTVEPFMPGMGHGSDGNVDPVYVGSGTYEGTVVFSMAGPWEVRFTLSEGAATPVEVLFDIEI